MPWFSAIRLREQRQLAQAGFRYALALTHNRDDAEDTLQRAWLKLIEAYGGVDNRPVLLRTIKNLVRDEHRRRQAAPMEALDDTNPVPTEVLGVDDPPVDGDLHRLLQQLGPCEREILYLSAVEGYTAAEIATHLEMPRGTVLSMSARAKAKLRRQFTNELPAQHS